MFAVGSSAKEGGFICCCEGGFIRKGKSTLTPGAFRYLWVGLEAYLVLITLLFSK